MKAQQLIVIWSETYRHKNSISDTLISNCIPPKIEINSKTNALVLARFYALWNLLYVI